MKLKIFIIALLFTTYFYAQNILYLDGIVAYPNDAPANPIKGQIYNDQTQNRLYMYDGSAWTTWALLSELPEYQTISFSSDEITLSNGGGTIDLSSYLDNTDSQTVTDLSISGNVLSITLSGGNTETVDLSPILSGVNTDNQELSISSNTLILESGGAVSLLPYLDNTDSQTITDLSLSGYTLSITLSGGNTQTVDLSSISGTSAAGVSLDSSFSNLASATNVQEGFEEVYSDFYNNVDMFGGQMRFYKNNLLNKFVDIRPRADYTTYDNTDSGLTANDVQDAIDELASGSGSDSGQSMSLQTKTDVTETFNNADVVNAGTATDKRKFTTFTGTNEITLDDTITLYNQPFLLFHKSATGSTTLKKGTGTTFIISDQGELSEDGVTFTDYANASVIALSSNEYLITCSTCATYTESTAIYQGNNAADPNNEVDSVVNTDNNSLFIITSVESSPNPQNGSSSLLFQQDNADNTSSDAYIELSGLDTSKTYTITLYTQEVNGLNWVVGLDDSQGWGLDDLKSVSADGVWVQMSFSGSPSVTNPKIRINGTASSDLGDLLAIDNIVITEQ